MVKPNYFNSLRLQRAIRTLNSPAAGLALLALAFAAGLTKVYFGRFVDEAENLAIGWLLVEGKLLYRDVFSHHFPLPYYWFAAVVGIFGRSFVAARISLLVLQVGLFAVCMQVTRFYLAIGLAALAWNLTNQFLRGQEATYAAFEGLFLVSVFILIFWMLIRRRHPGWAVLALIGVLMGAALLSDPLTVYPLAVAFAGLFASAFAGRLPHRWREGLRRVFVAAAAFTAVVGIFAANLLITNTWREFYYGAITFNAEIYNKYEDASPNRLGPILENAATGLDVLDRRWREYTSPFIPLTPYRSVRLEQETIYSKWLFAGLLARLSILACLAGLLLNRRFLAGVFLYLYSAALLFRAEDGFYTIGFTLVSLFAAFYLLVQLRRPALFRLAALRQPGRLNPGWKLARLAWAGLLVVIAAMQFWSALRGTYFLADNANVLADDRHVKMYNRIGRNIRQMACDQPGLELSVLPINPIANFVTGIPPASRYLWMYPWVAEIGQDELIEELRDNQAAVVWLNTERGLGRPDAAAVYLADTIAFLNENYVALPDDFWVSPALAERCQIDPSQSPLPHSEEVDIE